MIALGLGFFFFILIGVPVAFVFGLAALTVVVMTDLPLVIIAHQFFTGLNNFTLMAISFFLLAGMLMEEGGLARRITSYIEIRHAHRDFRGNRAAFLIADDRAIVYRSDASRWDGILEMNDPAVARRYLDMFDEAWHGSAPHAETRQLHL